MPDNSKIVNVALLENEARALLREVVRFFPAPIPFNFQRGQWDLMLSNLEDLERRIWKAKRVLAALYNAGGVPSGSRDIGHGEEISKITVDAAAV